MKYSKLVLVSGLTLALGMLSSQALAGHLCCPSDFKLGKQCQCSSSKEITCVQGGDLLYTHSRGVDVKGTTLYTRSGTTVNCKGSSWGVKMVSHQVGFRCEK